jgi:HlyD family secretion protein
MTIKKIIPIIFILLLIAFTGFNFLKKYKKSKPLENIQEIVPVEVIEAKVGVLDHVIELTGDLMPLFSVKIYPKIPGKVIENIYVDKGDEVKKGDLIATLERREINARLKQARANASVLESELHLIEMDFNRISNLFKKNSVCLRGGDRHLCL